MLKVKFKKININEVKEEELELISNVPLGQQFPNIFGDKQRITFDNGEVQNATQVANSFDNIVEGLTSQAFLKYLQIFISRLSVDNETNRYLYSLNYSSASINKVFDVIIPEGPRKGEKIQRTEKVKISRLQEIFSKCIEAFRQSSTESQQDTKELYPNFEEEIKRIFPITPPQYKELLSDPEKFLINFVNITKTDVDNAYQRYRFFSKYAKKPMDVFLNSFTAMSQLAGDYVIVLSRAPVDVARMSDFPGIESCHSPPRPKRDKEGNKIATLGGDKFDCAIHDAKSNGAVAFLVPKKNLDKSLSNLQSRELFKDLEREGVEGPTPIQRIRLRRYLHVPTNTELLVPEKQIYGGYRSVPFLKKLREKLTEIQSQQITNIMNNFTSTRDFILIGGSWSDTSTKKLIELFLNIDSKSLTQTPEDSLSDDDDLDTDDSMEDSRISEELLNPKKFEKEIISISNLNDDEKEEALENLQTSNKYQNDKIIYNCLYKIVIEPDKKIVSDTKKQAGLLNDMAKNAINQLIINNIDVKDLDLDIRYPVYNQLYNKISFMCEVVISLPQNGIFTNTNNQQIIKFASLLAFFGSKTRNLDLEFDKELKIQYEKHFNVKEQKAKYFNYYLRG